MKDITSVWTVNNGFALSKMLLTYNFELLKWFQGGGGGGCLEQTHFI